MQCLHVISGLGGGGAEGVLYNLCKHDSYGKHIVVSMSGDGVYGSLLRDSNIDVICLNIRYIPNLLWGAVKLWRVIKSNKPDVIQTWMYHADLFGGVIARVAGVRNIFWNVRHTNIDAGTLKFTTIIVAMVCARLSKIIPSKIICCSKAAANSHITLGYNQRKIIIIPNGYDFVKFSPHTESVLSVRNKVKIDDSIPLIGMVARFSPEKDHENLLKALHILQKEGVRFFCLLIGSGIDVHNNKLRKWIRFYSLSGHVHLLGPQRDIPAYLNALDLHVLSSQDEAFPNVLAEAMACGIPCVSTKVGDSEYILGGTGWVVNPHEPMSLAVAISDAFDCMFDRLLWTERKNAARNRIIDNFGIEKMINHYHMVWKDYI